MSELLNAVDTNDQVVNACRILKPSTRPLLQVAVDNPDLDKALHIAQAVGPYADIIEVGTPLLKSAGTRAIVELRKLLPSMLILADAKTPDVGALEAQLLFNAGADMMTVMGTAALATVHFALEEARKRPNREILCDLTAVSDVVARSQQLQKVGVRWVVLHRGIDEELMGTPRTETHFQDILDLGALGLKVSVAGGVNLDTLELYVSYPVSAIVVGRAITSASEPETAARAFKERINALWPA